MCSIVGFFMAMVAPVPPLYNCSLATFYLLKLKFSWTNKKIKAVEKWLLFVPCTVGLIFVMSSAVVEKFGPIIYICL